MNDEVTWMRLTMRPEAKKRRPNGTTTAAGATAIVNQPLSPKFNQSHKMGLTLLLLLSTMFVRFDANPVPCCYAIICYSSVFVFSS